jgi:hypothetical protein
VTPSNSHISGRRSINNTPELLLPLERNRSRDSHAILVVPSQPSRCNSNASSLSDMTASVFDSNQTVGSFADIVHSSVFDSLASIDSMLLRSSSGGPASPEGAEHDSSCAAPPMPSAPKRAASETEQFIASMMEIMNKNSEQPPSPPGPVLVLSASPPATREWEQATASQSWSNLGSHEDVDFDGIFRTSQDSGDSLPRKEELTEQKEEAAPVPDAQTSMEPAQLSPEVILPTDKDVLLGRGGRSGNHPGNKRYLALKDEMQKAYLDAEKSQKTVISQQLVDVVNNEWGGRFLKQEGGVWFEVSNEKARHKCSQALREINTAEVRAKKRARYAK